MTRRLKKILIGAGVAGTAAVAIALAGPSLASAADPNPTPSASASSNHAAAEAKHLDDLASALATELGVDKDKVAAALQKIESQRDAQRGDHPNPPQGTPGGDLNSRLDAAVAAGTLTQAEADAVKKAVQAGILPGGGGHRGGGPR